MPEQNSKAVLKELAAQATVYWNRSRESWIECAYVLLEARAVAGHGEWLPFIADIGLPERTAQRMLMIAGAGLKSDTVSDLGGVAKACEFIAAVGRARKNWTPARDASTGEVAALLGHVEPSARSIFLTGLWQVDLDTWSRFGSGGDPAPGGGFRGRIRDNARLGQGTGGGDMTAMMNESEMTLAVATSMVTVLGLDHGISEAGHERGRSEGNGHRLPGRGGRR